ncbi:hypothetical protein KVH24_15455 [Streptomyces olivaceus]|uniref:hypothetical protein n=1 Tax=Streptomyces olivaceus TaxID=47716 RepID=UPI001CCB99CE|nr:hypothetical protein [Streptomyces olivaceus]MBZ6174216.1 hypothetical protein [Streptomyces olivaceus]MBZ6180394.1 hypothetical protein [Streptomyces olivaceus]
MAYSFQLKLTSDGTSPHLYRALVDGTLEAFLLLDEDSGTVYLADREGAPSGGMQMPFPSGRIEVTAEESNSSISLGLENFKLLATHLGSQYRKQGKAPTEIRKFFA